MKNAISGRRFDFLTLPDVLQYSLYRKDLMRVQFKGKIAAMHEKEGASQALKTIVQTSKVAKLQ
jgi:hypothetical protein